jgi:hypothetical protein
MTIDGLPLKDADRIRFLTEAEHREEPYYEVRSYLPAAEIAAAPPPGPRPPPQLAAQNSYPTPTTFVGGMQEAQVLICGGLIARNVLDNQENT